MPCERFPVGVLIGGTELHDKLAQSAADGAEVVQVWCTAGELAPENFNMTVANRVLKRCDMLGLRITALCGDLGLGFCNPQTVAKAVEQTAKFFQVAQALGVPVVTSHIGHVNDPNNTAAHATALESLKKLGDIGAKRNVTFASETGSEDGGPLRAFLDDLSHPRIKLNFDPANMTMRGFDLESCVRLLCRDAVHTHAKDAQFKGGERAIGAGDIDWPQYLGWLKAVGYEGPLVIEREGGNAWRDDVRQGLALLRRWRALV
ncbi:MAG: sugar phosphate isomerase/epimerase [Planctomycetes bacterium]|nr:sugar phosphate isomerase/epimerase [Planctomycetota bacterium]